MLEWALWREGLPKFWATIGEMPASIGIGFEHLLMKLGKGNVETALGPGENSDRFNQIVNTLNRRVNSPFDPDQRENR